MLLDYILGCYGTEGVLLQAIGRKVALRGGRFPRNKRYRQFGEYRCSALYNGPAMRGSVQHLNPEGLHKNPAYSQAVVTTGNVRTVYVGGQNAVDASGQVVGRGDIGAQAEQIFKNLETALEAGGAKLDHMVKWNVYVVQGQSPMPAFEVFQRVWDGRSDPPLITLLFVSGLAQPEYLVEIEAVAVAPEE